MNALPLEHAIGQAVLKIASNDLTVDHLAEILASLCDLALAQGRLFGIHEAHAAVQTMGALQIASQH